MVLAGVLSILLSLGLAAANQFRTEFTLGSRIIFLASLLICGCVVARMRMDQVVIQPAGVVCCAKYMFPGPSTRMAQRAAAPFMRA